MANHKSALKRARQNGIRRLRNKAGKTRVNSAVKEVRSAVEQNETSSVEAKLNHAKSTIHKAAKKGIIPKKTADRKISRLTKFANSSMN